MAIEIVNRPTLGHHGKRRGDSMISITVNTPRGEFEHNPGQKVGPIPTSADGPRVGAIVEAINLLYPGWTSLVMTIARSAP